MKSQFDKKSSILAGSELRVLLNSDHISYGEIHSTLKDKGIFVGDADKSITVPLLSATLLTPKNFSKLIETSIDRESQPKLKSSSLVLVADNLDWITPLKNSLLDDTTKIIAGLDNVCFIENPEIVVTNKDQIKIQYELKRSDYSKDWLQRELTFTGEVIVSKKGNTLRLDFLSTHSSKETEAINRKLTTKISKILNNNKIVSSDQPQQIKFDSFDNEERIRFFKRLTSGIVPNLETGNVDNIEINLDRSAPTLPNDPQVAWMKNTVKRIKIDGSRLNDIFLISDEKYYKYYHIQKMDIEFPYNYGPNSGSCKVGFLFSSPTRAEDDYKKAELTFYCSRTTYKNAINAESKKTISWNINQSLKELIEEKYQATLNERNVSTPSKTIAVESKN